VRYRIIHEQGYTQDECLSYKPIIYSNAIQSMMAILKAMQQLNIEFGNAERSVIILCVIQYSPYLWLHVRACNLPFWDLITKTS